MEKIIEKKTALDFSNIPAKDKIIELAYEAGGLLATINGYYRGNPQSGIISGVPYSPKDALRWAKTYVSQICDYLANSCDEDREPNEAAAMAAQIAQDCLYDFARLLDGTYERIPHDDEHSVKATMKGFFGTARVKIDELQELIGIEK